MPAHKRWHISCSRFQESSRMHPQFSIDMTSEAVKRIDDVRYLRAVQVHRPPSHHTPAISCPRKHTHKPSALQVKIHPPLLIPSKWAVHPDSLNPLPCPKILRIPSHTHSLCVLRGYTRGMCVSYTPARASAIYSARIESSATFGLSLRHIRPPFSRMVPPRRTDSFPSRHSTSYPL
jgi:hypothetical protein